MPTPVESADLILKLYDLRREETMRKARDFVFTFNPQTVDDLMAGFFGPNGAYIRMVMSYWDMAANFVVSGAIDAKMFDDCHGEHVFVFTKVQHLLPEWRETMQNPRIMASLEQVCLNMPDSKKRIDATRERMRQVAARLAAAAGNNPAS